MIELCYGEEKNPQRDIGTGRRKVRAGFGIYIQRYGRDGNI
jgi:hypothetical protein